MNTHTATATKKRLKPSLTKVAAVALHIRNYVTFWVQQFMWLVVGIVALVWEWCMIVSSSLTNVCAMDSIQLCSHTPLRPLDLKSFSLVHLDASRK